ncbi:uncharacterized protein V6R79_008615 [Siganus canaliculatus]
MEYIQVFNSHHPLITVEPELDLNEVHFLDVVVYKGMDIGLTNLLSTKVYFKPTDTNALLHKERFHSKHVFSGILKSQLLRFRRICSDPREADNATQILIKGLRTRAYSRSFLRKVQSWMDSEPTKRRPDRRGLIPKVFSYSGYTTGLSHLLEGNFQMVFENTPFADRRRTISAYNRSLGEYLVRAELADPGTPRGSGGKVNMVFKRTTREPFPLQVGSSRSRTNVVYCIWCRKCGIQYVGETRNSIGARLSNHKYNSIYQTSLSGYMGVREGGPLCGLESWVARVRARALAGPPLQEEKHDGYETPPPPNLPHPGLFDGHVWPMYLKHNIMVTTQLLGGREKEQNFPWDFLERLLVLSEYKDPETPEDHVEPTNPRLQVQPQTVQGRGNGERSPPRGPLYIPHNRPWTLPPEKSPKNI